MKNVCVSLKENSYKIIVGHNILSKIGNQIKFLKIGDDAVIITNPLIKKLYGNALSKSLKKSKISAKFFCVPDTEKSKSQKVAFDVIQKIAQYDVKKKIFVIAFGGGVVGDLAGFVAALYKRGIPFIQVPTTFLAQVDSAIGGKVAIDLPAGKNLVGAFYQPKLVFSDVAVLKTLSQRQIRNGLAESVKYGVIKDKDLFVYISCNYKKLLSLDLPALSHVVLKCSHIKADVVSRDEKEKKGIRTILNFGHTIGHAIETVSSYDRYQHGEAVSIGMRAAGSIACAMGLFSQKDLDALESLLSQIGLPEKIKNVNVSSLMKIMVHDKKNISKKNRFVLPQKIGQVCVLEGVSLPLIQKTVKFYCA
ncbi:MAG: 3-dehydroquinate synthase [Candidatus Omnitrophica bacterium]|nr:3-dehydroquinate synthase [Candidatus Omnitrophota bacterium]